MDLRGKRFVVIGGAGLIGSHTVDALLREDVGEVVVYDNYTRGSVGNLAGALTDDRVTLFETGRDVLHPDVLEATLRGADGVFHFAALWLLQCEEFPRAGFEVNVAGTFNVLEACVRAGLPRLVFSSSASVYGDALTDVMTEDHPFNNTTIYGATKIAGEVLAHAFHHRDGLPYVGLRYMNVYGPRQDYQGAYIAVIMKMLDAIDRGDPVVIHGDGDQAYDFVYVGDCAAANVRAMAADTVDRFYNVGTGVKTSIRELAELLLELAGSDVGIRHEPAGPVFVTNRVASTERAAAEIGFEAQVGLREGLAALIEWRSQQKQRPVRV